MSYIKNGWENNFTESWKHLALDAKNVDVSSSSTNSPNTPHKFQQAANWCSLERAEFPSFTIENMINYFIKRKSGDDEGNKDYKNLNSKAFALFKHGHVQHIEVVIGESGEMIYIRCECLPEMKKNLKYKLNVTMINSREQAGEITYACCSPCPAGKGPFASCKHLAALCFKLGTNPGNENWNQDLCMKSTSAKRSMVERMQGTGRFFMTPDCLYTETLRKQTKTCSII